MTATARPWRAARAFKLVSVGCLAVSGAMLFLSFLCLCTAGQMVGYFLVAAGAALLPFGFDPNRARKLAGFGLIAVNMALAAADHEGGVRYDRQLLNDMRIRAATEPTQP